MLFYHAISDYTILQVQVHFLFAKYDFLGSKDGDEGLNV